MTTELSLDQSPPWEETNDSSDATTGILEHEVVLSAEAFSEEENEIPPEKAPLIDEIATEYIGFWNRLVSQTNWEKGKVIHTWRTRLIEAGLPRSVYSDDTIAHQIGNVSGQHVGRLRRVYEQFGEQERPTSLFWSHYQAALDWEDADQWLQKAAQEGWSVASMRIARWEKTGALQDRKPKENEIVATELDEDINPNNDSNVEFVELPLPGEMPHSSDGGKDGKKSKNKSTQDSDGNQEDDSWTDENSSTEMSTPNLDDFRGCDQASESSSQTSADILTMLSTLPPLPEDLGDAFELLKVAILNHKFMKWVEVSSDQLLDYLTAMRQLVFSRDV